MASELGFIQYVTEQIREAGEISYKKMFGEYMVYIDGRPLLLVCDNTVFVKILPETTEILGAENPQGFPYHGAKIHYVLDIDDSELAARVCLKLKEIVPLPKKRERRNIT